MAFMQAEAPRSWPHFDARRHPDEQKAEKARLAVIEEQAKAAAAAREKALDDTVFASI